MAGRSIVIFLPDGDPNGIRTVTMSNSLTNGTLFPRPLFGDFKKRVEANKPGVYMIYGEDFETSNRKLYIGEGDPIGPRLNSHYGNKDFWTNAIVFTSKDDFLGKTQIQYLESRLISLAREAGKVALDNGNSPLEPNISEVNLAEVKDFLDSILLLLKAMGIDFFIPSVKTNAQQNVDAYTMKIKNAEAKMLITEGKYVLLKGSTVVLKETNAAKEPLILRRKSLLENNMLSIIDNELMIVNDNLEFNSASQAGSVVAGIGVNGLTAWKLNGKTLKEIEQN